MRRPVTGSQVAQLEGALLPAGHDGRSASQEPGAVMYNLYATPREEKPTLDTWMIYPALKIVADFEASVKQHPLIPMGRSNPYKPPLNRVK